MEIKKLMAALKAAEKACDTAEDNWDNDLNNEELEKAFDEAYKALMTAHSDVVHEIMRLTGMSKRDAYTMMRIKRADVESLIERLR